MSNYKLHRYKKPNSYELQMMILPTFFVLCNYPLTIPMGYTNHKLTVTFCVIQNDLYPCIVLIHVLYLKFYMHKSIFFFLLNTK